ncbi:MAG: hypothetical protein A3I66_11925 [Burkholderiales bacterium RIFCSPLOWO2_02_FULL_57_36]|nr:MAG: hypothetical protein A3I66_11925 [Burkholderiales bacterium RIFCSPLOWO2_02_FULL_57_36]
MIVPVLKIRWVEPTIGLQFFVRHEIRRSFQTDACQQVEREALPIAEMPAIFHCCDYTRHAARDSLTCIKDMLLASM